MRIVRITDGANETYGFVKGDKIAIKSEITELTGVPIPINVKDFLFDGWYEEIKNKTHELEYREEISKYKLLAPIPNPNKIICLAFNYVDHAKEQGLQAPDDPALVIKPRTALNHTKSDIICPDFVTQLDYEIELALIISQDCKNVSDAAGLYLYISGDLMTKADEAEKSGRDIKAATLYKRSLEFAEIAANHAKSFEAFCKQPS